ncbi:tetratricopeptide repeat-containing protein [Psychroserpens sp. BH13MA-6]
MEKICFVIMGYGKKTDPTLGKTFDLDVTYNTIIKPSVENAGYTCIRGDEVLESGIIDKSMYALLIHSDLVIADITTFNPNAIYELGIRHAARPYSTIVMKEKDGNIPFDINHNKTFTYSHMGEDIGSKEAERCVKHLTNLILEIDKSQETDSPLFHHIRGVKPYSLPEDEYIQVIKELADKEKSIFALTEKAKYEMNNSNFKEAKKFWKKLVDKVENDTYFVQQLALCTYKDKTISSNIALIDALGIIKQLEPDDRNTIDPETLGITGAVYKRLWENNNVDIEYLDRAIEYYKRGFTINQDYYTGENYALCLNLKASITVNPDEKIYLNFSAKKTRKEIIEIIQKLAEDEDFEIRSDLMWIYATLSNCYMGIEDEENHQLYEKKFKELNPVDWQQETYEKSLNHLKELLK